MSRAHCHLRELGNQLRGRPKEVEHLGRVLIIDDEGEDYEKPLAAILPECRFFVELSPTAAKQHFLSSPIDLVILNHSHRISCLELLPAFKSFRPSVPVVVVTGRGSEELAVQAFRNGAIDYFRKPFPLQELELSIRAVLEIRKKSRQSRQPLPASGMQRALQFIETNYRSPLKLEKAAREAGMSISCFERSLKIQTGMTFVVYLNSLRIARAKELLQASSASGLQVALASGFSNQSNFNRVFKKLTGITPGEFRKTLPWQLGEP